MQSEIERMNLITSASLSMSNFSLREDPMLARERFAIRLRNSKRKDLLDLKRMKLTKRKSDFPSLTQF